MDMGEDRISLLPDCVLGNIVGLLPLKDAACTMVLSDRWKPIWPSMPLELDLDVRDSAVPADGRSISRVLSSHGDGGHIQRFRATIRADKTTRGWLETLAQRRIHDSLVLDFDAGGGGRQVIPVDLLACGGAALRHLELQWCRLVDPHPRAPLALSCLGQLTLSFVKISDASLHRVIAGCPALRELRLWSVRGLRRLVPSSRTLIDVHLKPHVPLDELSFRDTPNLQTIALPYVDIWRLYPTIITEAALPSKLRAVHLALPMLDSPSFTITPKSSVSIVTVLVLNLKFSDGEELRKAARVLGLFPCLQHLRIWCLNFSPDDKLDEFGRWLPAADTITCLNKHLKHVRLLGYCGTRGELEFARFLMAGAKVLKVMHIIHAINWSNEHVNSQRELISKCGKASPEVQVNFEKDNMIENTRREADSSVREVCFV